MHPVRSRLAFATTVLGLGCAAEPARVDDAGAAESTDTNGAVVYHYPPAIDDVAWHASGVTVTYRKAYADLLVSHAETLDEDARTLTIVVDTWSYDRAHPLVPVPQDALHLSPALSPEAPYDVVVRDRAGTPLWTGAIAAP